MAEIEMIAVHAINKGNTRNLVVVKVVIEVVIAVQNKSQCTFYQIIRGLKHLNNY